MLLFNVLQDFSYKQEGQTIRARKGQRIQIDLRSEADRAMREGVVALAESRAPARAPARIGAPVHRRTPAPAQAPVPAPAPATQIEEGSIVRVKQKKGAPKEAEVLAISKRGVKIRYDGGKCGTVSREEIVEVIA